MQKIAHLIVAFKNPEQLQRLVRSIQHPNADIFIHIDRKIDIDQFAHIGDMPGVHFVQKRHYVVWGGYSITECYIDGMEEILQRGSYDHIVLMSGQDYPIRPIEELHSHLKENRGFSIMKVEEQLPKSSWWYYANDRYKYYHLNDFTFPGRKLLHKILKHILPQRKFLFPDYKLYGGPGATFCALTGEAAAYIVGFMKNNRKAQRYARFTHASDEFWFQTLLMNSPLKDKVINRALWYIDWGGVSRHPRILTVLDYPSLIASGLFFARKVDIYADQGIFDMLDAHLNDRKNLRPAFKR